MAINPYPNQPMTVGGNALQGWAVHASVKAVYASDNQSASSVITLTPDTTAVEITTIGAVPTAAAMRWVRTTDASTAATSVITAAGSGNFHHVIPGNSTLKLAVPIEVMYQAPSSLVGTNISNGLYRRLAYKSIGVSSILVVEF